MFAIFTNPKKLVLEAKAPPETVIKQLQSHICAESLWDHTFPAVGKFVGKVEGKNISVRYLSAVRNSLKPTMHIHIEAVPGGGSVLLTRFSTFLFPKIFLTVWMTMALLGGIYSILSGIQSGRNTFVEMPLFGIVLIAVCRLVASTEERKLEGLVRNSISEAELSLSREKMLQEVRPQAGPSEYARLWSRGRKN